MATVKAFRREGIRFPRRTRYEVELARRRYMQVDPDNRLVADELEGEWNHKLQAFTEAQEQYDKQKQEHDLVCDEEQRRKVMALATDFPQLWNDPATSHRDRKQAVRLLIEDVTLRRGEHQIEAQVRLRGGTTQTLCLPLPRPAWALRKTSQEVITEIDRLLEHHTHSEIAGILNERGLLSGDGRRFNRLIVGRIQTDYGLKPRYDRLREAGVLTLEGDRSPARRLHSDDQGVATQRLDRRSRLQRQASVPLRASKRRQHTRQVQVEGHLGDNGETQTLVANDEGGVALGRGACGDAREGSWSSSTGSTRHRCVACPARSDKHAWRRSRADRGLRLR